jgi:predicted amidohydrolase
MQPKDDLNYSEQLGPHYNNGAHEIGAKRVDEFLRIVQAKNAELAIAPEYFLLRSSAWAHFVFVDRLNLLPKRLDESC